MKVRVRTAVRSCAHDFQCFDQQQIIFPCGNTLCIKELGKNEAEFICLSKHLQRLYSFKPATNKKGVFTAERGESDVEVAFYGLNGERKAISLSHQSSFFIEAELIQLLADDYDNNIVYGWSRNHQGCCVFLADFSKGKILALGYLPFFEDIKVDSRENMTLSLCGHNGTFNYLKSLRYGLGQWQVQEWPYKKIAQHHGSVLAHDLFHGGRMLVATKNSIYIFEEMNILQVHELPAAKRITTITKIPKGFLVLLEDQIIELYAEQADELAFSCKGVLPLSLEQGDSINLMHASFSGEEVLVRTVRNNLYRWRTEHIALDQGHSDMRFKRIQSSCQSGEEHLCLSISTGKRLCLMTGPTTATIWSLQTNSLILRSQFSTAESSRRNIIASAIHPDGNSFIIAFQDRIRIYKILLTKFKLFSEFFMKRCSQIVYSHGGQLVACRYGRGANSCIQVINLLRLVEVSTIKVQAEPIQIVWNELDDELIVSAENKTVQVFRVADNIRTCNIKFQTPIHHVRLDYRVRKLLVSTADKISVVDGGDVIDEIVPPIKGFQYVYPLYGLYFIVSNNGVLYWSTSLRFQNYSRMPLFRKQSFHLLCRNGFLLAHAGEDVLLLECVRDGARKRVHEGDVVMVQREEVMGVFDRVRDLESSLQLLQSATQSQLQQQKANYQRAIDKFKQQYKTEINFLNNQLAQLTSAKLRQQRDNQKTFRQLQGGQVKNVNDLEKMFTRRLALQKERLMEAEQLALEEKQRYQRMIYELEGKYHQQVGQVREQYARRTREEVQRVEDIKRHNLQDKQRIEFKLLDLEEENEVAITEIQRDKDQIIQALRHKVTTLEGDYDTLLIKYHNQEQELAEIQEQQQYGAAGLLQTQQMLREANNRVKMLQADIAKKIATIQEKNQVIRQQGHQIQGLEKAKAVLSMRTTEIRRQLQPKQALVDKLKAEIYKLDGQFKQQKRTVFQLGQKIEKMQKMGQVMKRENFEMRSQLKLKERSYDELSSQIFMVINTADPKDWNAAFVKIYQTHIKDPSRLRLKGKRKDDSAVQINRHLVHVEYSLQQVSSANDKNLRRKEEELAKKMQENSNLLYELNLMRKNERLVERQKKEMGAALQRLKRELSENHKSSNFISTRAQTSTATKRATASRDVISRDKSLLIDTSEYAEPITARDIKTRSRVRSRMSSGSKTPVLRHQTRQQSNKFFQIAKELQTCRNTIRVQDEVIEELNQRLFSNDAPQN